MLFSPRGVAFLIALCVALITTAFLSLVGNTPITSLVGGLAVSCCSTFVVRYRGRELLIFIEINKIYDLIEQLKQRDFKISRKQISAHINPLRKLNAEILAYTTKKEQEIHELKRLESYRREFLADVSHELKTPFLPLRDLLIHS
jgi:two-component system phosphate regulon sensor histidine kinase PhoR